MNIQKKAQAMTVSEIIRTMTAGLRKRWVQVEMFSFGGAMANKICFGCAATNTLCELRGRSFSPKTISYRPDRARVSGTNARWLTQFEYAIDKLRVGILRGYNNYASTAQMAQIPEAFFNYKLPILEGGYTEADLAKYDKLADDIERETL